MDARQSGRALTIEREAEEHALFLRERDDVDRRSGGNPGSMKAFLLPRRDAGAQCN